MNYKQIFLRIFLCIAVEFVVYNINHTYKLFDPFFFKISSASYEKRSGDGEFTNPLLECLGVEGDESSKHFRISEPDLQDFINKTTLSHNLTIISVYIRDLNNGPWM